MSDAKIVRLPKMMTDGECKSLIAWLDGLEIGEVAELKRICEARQMMTEQDKYPLLTACGIEVGDGNYNDVWVFAGEAEKALATERARSQKLLEALQELRVQLSRYSTNCATAIGKFQADE